MERDLFWEEWETILPHIEDSIRSGEQEMIEQQTAVKYIKFNMSRVKSPTWVHIASGKPFAIMPGQFGRYSSTVCGKEYESDDYSVVKDEAWARAHLCKKCAKLAGIEHERNIRHQEPDLYDKSVAPDLEVCQQAERLISGTRQCARCDRWRDDVDDGVCDPCWTEIQQALA
jgi:hypothetical protein